MANVASENKKPTFEVIYKLLTQLQENTDTFFEESKVTKKELREIKDSLEMQIFGWRAVQRKLWTTGQT